jgi:hypothetical protein
LRERQLIVLQKFASLGGGSSSPGLYFQTHSRFGIFILVLISAIAKSKRVVNKFFAAF